MLGLTNYDKMKLTNSQADTLLTVWPKETCLDSFAKEVCQPGEQWARAEKYFIQMVEPASILPRLQIWMFVENWSEVMERASDFHGKITAIYDIIMNDKVFFEMLGYILAVGNVLNGGSAKGQADGYDLQVIGKVHTFRDNSGQSILQYVCKAMKAKDENFPEYVKGLLKKVTHRATDTDIYKAISTEMGSKSGNAKSALA